MFVDTRVDVTALKMNAEPLPGSFLFSFRHAAYQDHRRILRKIESEITRCDSWAACWLEGRAYGYESSLV